LPASGSARLSGAIVERVSLTAPKTAEGVLLRQRRTRRVAAAAAGATASRYLLPTTERWQGRPALRDLLPRLERQAALGSRPRKPRCRREPPRRTAVAPPTRRAERALPPNPRLVRLRVAPP